MSVFRICSRCCVAKPADYFQLTGGGYRHTVCRSCVAGAHRVAALARSRPHLHQLVPEAASCLLAWETGRLAFSRALRRAGVDVRWRGFEPTVRVHRVVGGTLPPC